MGVAATRMVHPGSSRMLRWACFRGLYGTGGLGLSIDMSGHAEFYAGMAGRIGGSRQ